MNSFQIFPGIAVLVVYKKSSVISNPRLVIDRVTKSFDIPLRGTIIFLPGSRFSLLKRDTIPSDENLSGI
jgi:hypothetical protein